MRKILYNLIGFALTMVVVTGCKKDILVEENHSKLTEDFFASNQGFEKGLNAAYAGLRDFYGPEEGIEAFTSVGTDEFRIANGNRVTDVANYSSGYTTSNEFSGRIWNSSYRYINTCNGLIDFGQNITGISETLKKQKIAEAKFLRAFYYFTLVRFFGDVTLNKNYSNSPTTSAVRTDKAEVYDFIVSDLQSCITDLSPSPKKDGLQQGRTSIAAARHLLSLVYLTRGYSDDAKPSDFQDALTQSKTLIDQSAALGLGLLPNYADVHRATNENNMEVLFSVQYNLDLTFGGSHAWNHLYVNKYDTQLGERNIKDGRSYAWFRGTNWLYNTAFGDKVNDTRYFGTFQTAWIATLPRKGTYIVKIDGVSHTLNYDFKAGDTAMVMPGVNRTLAQMQNKKYYIYTPENYTDATIFPTMKKYLDPNRLIPNENSHRPIIVFRLAETYLIAAEAAFKLTQTGIAADYINVVRKRAAATGKQANMEINAADVDIDFILDERTRELCAENVRWLDLVRTGKLLERVKLYDDWEAKKNIKAFHVIRPIPQSQINAVITGPKYPQNLDW